MSFFSPPKYDANGVAGTQFNYNQDAASVQQKMNMFNQVTPTGSLNYEQDLNAPGGYSANVTLTPEQQQILQQQQQSKINTGAAANSLTSNFADLYGSPPNIDPSSLTNKMMGWGQQYMQPIFDQQQSNLDAKLQNQGITQGSQAYNNAQNLQSRNVNNAYQNLFLNAEPTAFNQAIQEYQLPMQTAYGLSGQAGGPQNPAFQNTPQAQVQPPNYQQGAQYGTSLAQSQYQNMMSGLGQLAGAGMGMFGGGWGGGGGGGGSTVTAGMYGGVPYPIFG